MRRISDLFIIAQCLNPDINVIHQLTLEVYEEVFKREVELIEMSNEGGAKRPVESRPREEIYSRNSSIALFFSGLFNFYQFAAFEVKQNFLQLVENYMLKLHKEVILSLPGFILCMLPALEEQNSEILRRVEGILKKTEEIVGTSVFCGEVWKAMLRTPRARLSAIKYLEKRIPNSPRHAVKDTIYPADYKIMIINREVTVQYHPEGRENEAGRIA